jgi:dinuclear metal center YbgI/SA1388 family protein
LENTVVKVFDIVELLDKWASSQYAESWDNPGLQVGSLSQDIRKILFSLDASLQAVEEATKRRAQLLLTHHPLILTPLRCLISNRYPDMVVMEAVKRGISILSAHTNLDKAIGGINDMLADLLGLLDVEVLEKSQNLHEEGIGLGRIGQLPETIGLSNFITRIKAELEAESVRLVGPKQAEIRRVAVVGGSGGSLIPLASDRGAHVLVTGDLRHHEVLEARHLGLPVVDAGHFNTERAGFHKFAARFKEELRTVNIDVVLEVNDGERNYIHRC